MSEYFETEIQLFNSSNTSKKLLEFDPQLINKIERGIYNWNKPIRDILRSETGFRLARPNRNGNSVPFNIPVTLSDGIPTLFKDAIYEFTGLEWLLAAKPMLCATEAGLKFLDSNKHNVTLTINRFAHNKSIPDKFTDLIELISTLQKILNDNNKFDKVIKEFNTDIFGQFCFGEKTKVDIFWIPIAIFSLYKNLDPESLAIVVLAHELAHAYTLSGCDIDGGVWNRNAIKDTELEIIEGIAQYYTQIVCERISDQKPTAIKAFYELLEVQNEIYNCFKEWNPDLLQSGEAVRASLIECRTKEITKIYQFRNIVTQNLAGKPKKINRQAYLT